MSAHCWCPAMTNSKDSPSASDPKPDKKIDKGKKIVDEAEEADAVFVNPSVAAETDDAGLTLAPARDKGKGISLWGEGTDAVIVNPGSALKIGGTVTAVTVAVPAGGTEESAGDVEKAGGVGESGSSSGRKRGRPPKTEGKVPTAEKPKKKAPELTDLPSGEPKCQYCGRTFASWKAVFGHMRSHKEREQPGAFPPPVFTPPGSPNREEGGSGAGASGASAGDSGAGASNTGRGLDADLNAPPAESDAVAGFDLNLPPSDVDNNEE